MDMSASSIRICVRGRNRKKTSESVMGGKPLVGGVERKFQLRGEKVSVAELSRCCNWIVRVHVDVMRYLWQLCSCIAVGSFRFVVVV